MPTKYIMHACGHPDWREVNGTIQQRESYTAWVGQYKICRDCYKAEALLYAQQLEEQRGWPKLSGTDKQVAWATSIRASAITSIEQHISKLNPIPTEILSRCRRLIEILLSHSKADWWIEERYRLETNLAATIARYATPHR